MPICNMSNTTSKFRAVAMFVTLNAERHTQYVYMFTISICAIFTRDRHHVW
jgi:hypothetical protein